MDAVEHSTLVSLLDAVKAEPAKLTVLLRLASTGEEPSEQYRKAIAALRTAAKDHAALLAKSEELRKELR